MLKIDLLREWLKHVVIKRYLKEFNFLECVSLLPPGLKKITTDILLPYLCSMNDLPAHYVLTWYIISSWNNRSKPT
jgi:hypothetical protein